MGPVVSVIVPVYNAQKSLARCIDSILNQTFKDFELILLDDGSTDTSGEICDRYAEIDERVRVIHKENSGVSDTRNRGLDIAEGKYLQFLDSDDWITPEATGLFVRTAEENQCDMVIADFYRVIGERVSQKGAIEEDGLMDQVTFAENMLQKPADFYYGVLWNKLYKREIVESYRLRMDSSVSWCEDFMFNLEYVRHIRSVYALKVPVYYYVKTKGSLVSQGMSVKKTIQMKRTVFEYYNSFCKDVFDEEDYEKYKVQVYRFLIEAAGDGVVAPSILPGSYKLGAERTSVSEGVQEGEGFFFDLYRERKLQERLFDVVALKNELQTVDIKLLFYFSRPHENCTFKETTEILDITRRELSFSIQSLLSRNLIEVKEKPVNRTKTRKTRDRSEKDLVQEPKRKTKASEYVLTPEADGILAEALLVLDDFEQLQYEGFSQEEIIMFERLNEKRNQNIRRALAGKY
ncbi:glycosyltransferase family 2 protein [Blautia sp. HCP3S3_G3]|uniref:glycosyltransferase family 2 protein n=1 Tax=Blautia sp. HCP3S3_G3 TaxID=3438913 RepID=UPI003F8AF227